MKNKSNREHNEAMFFFNSLSSYSSISCCLYVCGLLCVCLHPKKTVVGSHLKWRKAKHFHTKLKREKERNREMPHEVCCWRCQTTIVSNKRLSVFIPRFIIHRRLLKQPGACLLFAFFLENYNYYSLPANLWSYVLRIFVIWVIHLFHGRVPNK